MKEDLNAPRVSIEVHDDHVVVRRHEHGRVVNEMVLTAQNCLKFDVDAGALQIAAAYLQSVHAIANIQSNEG